MPFSLGMTGERHRFACVDTANVNDNGDAVADLVHDSFDYAATVLGREQQAFASAAAEVEAVDFLAEHIVDEFAEGGQIGCAVGVCRCNERGPCAV